MKLGGSLSYAWQELVRGADESSGVLPKARGLAFFARALDADGSQMRRAGKQDLKTLVIGRSTLCGVGLSFGGSTSTHGLGRVYGDLLEWVSADSCDGKRTRLPATRAACGWLYGSYAETSL